MEAAQLEGRLCGAHLELTRTKHAPKLTKPTWRGDAAGVWHEVAPTDHTHELGHTSTLGTLEPARFDSTRAAHTPEVFELRDHVQG